MKIKFIEYYIAFDVKKKNNRGKKSIPANWSRLLINQHNRKQQ